MTWYDWREKHGSTEKQLYGWFGMEEKMYIIRNGLVCNPENGFCEKTDVIIDGNKVQRIGCATEEECVNAEKLIDATDCVVAPGLMDVHVHFRDPGFTYKEDIETGAKAALKGGFTSVVLMANTKPVVDNVETLQYVLEKGRKTGLHVYSCSAITRGLQGKEIIDMDALHEAGAVGFTDDGIPILEEKVLRKAFEKAGSMKLPVSLHEENPQYITNNGVNRGKASEYFGIGGSSREAEISMVDRDLKIAVETNAIVNIQHISTKEAVELVRKSKQVSQNVHAEATPHHFSLTEEATIAHGTLAKMNPPLREEADRQAIIRGLQDGTIDIIATDHAPHSREEKEKSITEAPSGILGLETALSLGITNLVEPGFLTINELLYKMTVAPADLYHLPAGRLAEGENADIVIFAPEEKWIVNEFESKSGNSPFVGQELSGVIKYTITDGNIVYQK